MRRGSSRKKKKEKKEKSCDSKEKTPTVSFTQSDGYIRYPDYQEAVSSSSVVKTTQWKNVTNLQLKEKADLLLGEGEEEELLDYSPKEGTVPLNSARLTYRIWGNGQLCENRKPYDEVKFCFLCDLETDQLRHGTRMTGEKLDGNGGMYPIYRHLFMCLECFEKNPREKKVRVTTQTLQVYYSCDQK